MRSYQRDRIFQKVETLNQSYSAYIRPRVVFSSLEFNNFNVFLLSGYAIVNSNVFRCGFYPEIDTGWGPALAFVICSHEKNICFCLGWMKATTDIYLPEHNTYHDACIFGNVFFSFNIVIIMIRIPGSTTFDLDLISVAATLAPFRLWFSRHEKSLRSFSFNNHFSLRRAPRGRIQNTVQGFYSTSHLIFFLECDNKKLGFL